MKKALQHITLAVALLLPGSAFAKPVVVELFTSQGCSSCPPADHILGELAEREDVIALTFPVTYWDYLGWKDTLADGEFTDRQRRYARKLHLRQVYTPQLIVDGAIDVIGSHKDEVEAAIAAQQSTAPGPALTLTHVGDSVHLTISAGPQSAADILILPLSPLEEVDIRRGENSGRQIAYHNVVRAIRNIGRYDGTAIAQELPMASMWLDGATSCAVLVQDRKSGAILSAALLDMTAQQP